MGSTEDKQPLLGGSETEIEGLQQEIEGLLTRLSVINDEMATYASGAANSGGGAAVHHTIQRHTEILADYRGEFSKTSANIAAIMEREELLGSVSQVEIFIVGISSNDFIQFNSTVVKMEAEM